MFKLLSFISSLLLFQQALVAEPFFAAAPPEGEVLALDIPPGFDDLILVYLASRRPHASNVAVGIAGPEGTDAQVMSGSLSGGIEAVQGRLASAPLLTVATSSQGTMRIAEGIALFVKDSCRVKTRNVIQLVVSLRGIDAAVRAEGFRILALLEEQRYRGPMAASIKPRADGRFAPQPLLLMSSVSAFAGGKEAIFQYRFQGARALREKQVPIEDYVPYKNLLLTRSPIEGLIRQGGRGTFVLVGEKASYSVCFEMARKRQVRNGYPM
jgi:hypothetical protein